MSLQNLSQPTEENESSLNGLHEVFRRLRLVSATLVIAGLGALATTAPSAHAERYPLDYSMYDDYISEWAGHWDYEFGLFAAGIPLNEEECSATEDTYFELDSDTFDQMSRDGDFLEDSWRDEYDGYYARAKRTAAKKYRANVKKINRWYKKNKSKNNSKKIKRGKLKKAKTKWLTRWLNSRDDKLWAEYLEAIDWYFEVYDDARETIDSYYDEIQDFVLERCYMEQLDSSIQAVRR